MKVRPFGGFYEGTKGRSTTHDWGWAAAAVPLGAPPFAACELVDDAAEGRFFALLDFLVIVVIVKLDGGGDVAGLAAVATKMKRVCVSVHYVMLVNAQR